MTADEQQAWRKVKTDDEARDLMDLFFARRDPTPGTPRNEFRTEFESRVAFADRQFKEGDVRGSLTERGRTLIVLGFPRNLDVQASHQSSQSGNVQGFDPNDPTGGRQMAAKDVWTYTHEAAAKFGVPKIEVVFIHDFTGDRVHRDPQRTDFTMALPGAIRSYIVSPDLTTVPEWAASRLTDDRTIVPAQESAQTSTTETVKKTQTIIDAPRPIARPAGAGKLTLLADTNSLKPQSGADPFVIASLDHFKKDQDLGWAAEYCSGVISENALPVKVQLKLAGKDGTISSDPEEYVPDSIKASPGCYLLRGSVPLSDVDPGSYTLTVAITGTGGQQSYNLTRELRVE
jgi:GWxTD domain-containing protein